MPVTVAFSLIAVLVPAGPSPTASASRAPAPAHAIASCTKSSGHTDDFVSRLKTWKERKPGAGPAFSLRNGCLSVKVPASATYDAWAGTDKVPEWVWPELGPVAANWTATTRLTPVSSGSKGGGIQAGMVLRFDDAATAAQAPVQVFWGLTQSGPGQPLTLTAAATYNVNAYGSVIGQVAKAPNTTITLRTSFTYDGGKCLYRFAYRLRDSGGFTTIPQTYANCVSLNGVGLFMRTFGAPRSAAAKFDWFELSRASQTGMCNGNAAGADPFSGSRQAVWRDRMPLGGPSFSLTGAPGCLTLTTPTKAAFPAWAGTDQVPEMLRDDLGPFAADWTATARLTLAKARGFGGGLHTGLVVRLGAATGTTIGPTQLFWGIAQSGPGYPLSLLAATTYNVTAYGPTIAEVKGATGTVTVRLSYTYDGGKCTYHFAYRYRDSASFTALPQTYAACMPIDGLGLFTSTSGSPRAVVTHFDYFGLERAPRLPACSTGGSHTDGFDGKYDVAWRERIPVTGPTFSLSAESGCLTLSTPDSRTYDAWAGTDEVPELLLDNSHVTAGNWTATTRVTLAKIPSGGGILTGLVVRIPEAKGTTLGKTQLFWGINDPRPGDPVDLVATSTYNVTAYGPVITQVKSVPSTVTLRLTNRAVPDGSCPGKTRYDFSFAYQLEGQTAFTTRPETFKRCEGITDLGLFTRISGATRQTATTFDWFDFSATS